MSNQTPIYSLVDFRRKYFIFSKKKILPTSILILFVTVLAGQEQLTLNEVISQTLENNFSIRYAENTKQISANNQSIYNTEYLPTASVSSGLSYTNEDQRTRFVDGNTQNSSNINQPLNASVGINYVLFNGFRLHNMRQLQAQYELSELQLRQVVENILVSTYAAFYQVAQLTQTVAIQKENLAVSKRRALRSQYAFEYGVQTKLDWLNAQVALNADSIAYVNATQLLKNAKRNLNLIMAREVSADYEVADQTTINTELRLEELQQYLDEKNSAILMADQNTLISEHLIKMNRAGWLPVVALNGSYSWNKTYFQDANQDWAQRNGLGAGLTVSWNPFDGGKTRTQVRNAQISRETQLLQAEEVRLQTRRNLLNAWEIYQNALFVLGVQTTNLETSQLNFSRSEESYKLGNITNIEYRAAQVNLLDAKLDYLDAQYTAKNAEVSLMQLGGELLQTLPE